MKISTTVKLMALGTALLSPSAGSVCNCDSLRFDGASQQTLARKTVTRKTVQVNFR